jgi:hypothetical protein
MVTQQEPKHKIEVWASMLSYLHMCLGLNREGKHHPMCQQVLQTLVKDVEELMQSL